MKSKKLAGFDNKQLYYSQYLNIPMSNLHYRDFEVVVKVMGIIDRKIIRNACCAAQLYDELNGRFNYITSIKECSLISEN